MTTTLISATTVAIKAAQANGTLTVTEGVNRFGDTFFAISDDHGLIEVAMNAAELQARTSA